MQRMRKRFAGLVIVWIWNGLKNLKFTKYILLLCGKVTYTSWKWNNRFTCEHEITWAFSWYFPKVLSRQCLIDYVNYSHQQIQGICLWMVLMRQRSNKRRSRSSSCVLVRRVIHLGYDLEQVCTRLQGGGSDMRDLNMCWKVINMLVWFVYWRCIGGKMNWFINVLYIGFISRLIANQYDCLSIFVLVQGLCKG